VGVLFLGKGDAGSALFAPAYLEAFFEQAAS
jgi:hypothetical protein